MNTDMFHIHLFKKDIRVPKCAFFEWFTQKFTIKSILITSHFFFNKKGLGSKNRSIPFRNFRLVKQRLMSTCKNCTIWGFQHFVCSYQVVSYFFSHIINS